eukprot:3729333-Pyramimonas_sp.AAC.1
MDECGSWFYICSVSVDASAGQYSIHSYGGSRACQCEAAWTVEVASTMAGPGLPTCCFPWQRFAVTGLTQVCVASD